MNILFTSHFFPPSIGGIEAISDLLSKYFYSSGNNLKVVTQTIADKSYDLCNYEFEILRNPSPLVLFRAYLWSDIVFQNNIELKSLWPLLFVRRPLVIGLQTWLRTSTGRRGLVQLLKKLVLHSASHVIACSNAIKDDSLLSATVIGNPYDDSVFYRREIPKIKNTIVFLGRLVSDKGVDLLLEACDLLPRSSFNLTIIGSGPELAHLRELVKRKGLLDCVLFLGPTQGERLAEILNQHDIMVVPSRWREPFGIVALEGLACGCVVIAANGGGLSDAVGPAGILFERNDYRDLSNKIKYLFDHPQQLEDLRVHSYHHLPQFNSSIVSQRYLDVLSTVRSKHAKRLNSIH